MTPVAPDYVNQVRGIIGDLRENYLKKQQLYQQDQQEQDRLALSYAQLGQQAANQAQQADIDTKKIAAAEAQNASQLVSAQAAAQAKALTRDLEERKFKWDQLKTLQELQQKKEDREQDLAAGTLEQEGMIALESDDPIAQIEWQGKVRGSILNAKQRNDVLKNALALVATKRQLDQQNLNLKTQGQAIDLINEINFTDVRELSSEALRNKIDDVTKRYAALGNRDEKLSESLHGATTAVAKRHDDYLKSDLGVALGEFETRAIRGRLPKHAQKQWDELQARYPEKEDRLSENYINEKNKLMYQTTDEESQTELKSWAKRINNIERNFLAQHPELAARVVNPETGAVEDRFPIAPPDVSYSVGYDAAIHPLTGKINQAKRKEYDAWLNDVNQKGYLNLPSQNPLLQPILQAMSTREFPSVSPTPTTKPGQTPQTPQPNKTPATAQPNQETAQAGQPQIKVTQFNFPQVAEAGTAIIPTAPSAEGTAKVQLSPETKAKIAEVVNLYNSNPDALYRGQPVRDVVAKLKQQLGTLPGLGQRTEENLVQGQTR